MLWLTLLFFRKIVNLFEDVQRRESWEYFPLELRLHTVDAIQFLEMIILKIPLDLLFPSLVRVFFFEPPRQIAEVGEEAGLGIRDLINSVTQQACRAPMSALRNQSLAHQ